MENFEGDSDSDSEQEHDENNMDEMISEVENFTIQESEDECNVQSTKSDNETVNLSEPPHT